MSGEFPAPENVAPSEVVMDPEWSASAATTLRRAIDASMKESDRSKWAESNHLGISDIGHCREYVRRMIAGVPWVDEQEDFAAAFIGTAVGAYVEKAVAAAMAEASTQMKVTLDLDIRGYKVSLPGTADVMLDRKSMIDVKTKDGLGVVRRSGPTLQQVFQVTLYATALIQAGVLDEDCHVGLAFIDRSGREPDPFVYGWRYDARVLDDIRSWLDDVIYALENDETASKDQPRNVCFAVCPYASDCRGMDTDVTGVLRDPEVVAAARVYRETTDAIRALEKDQKSAVSVLRGKAGQTGEFTVRWINVPAGYVEGYERRAYERIDVRRTKKGASA